MRLNEKANRAENTRARVYKNCNQAADETRKSNKAINCPIWSTIVANNLHSHLACFWRRGPSLGPEPRKGCHHPPHIIFNKNIHICQCRVIDVVERISAEPSRAERANQRADGVQIKNSLQSQTEKRHWKSNFWVVKRRINYRIKNRINELMLIMIK